VTLGEELTAADLIGRVETLISQLNLEKPGRPTVDAARARLAELLGEHDILMVIDDVWNSAHLKPFLLCGGQRCARLITTRNKEVCLPTSKVEVKSMEPEEAITLLGTGLAEKDNAREQLHALAARLYRWPQLLGMVNGVLRRLVSDRASLNDALAFVNNSLSVNESFRFPFGV